MISAVVEYEDGIISTHTSKVKTVGTKFVPGYYQAHFDDRGVLIINTKKLIEIHNPYVSDENNLIIQTIDNFFKDGIREAVEQMGFIHKLGILMYGKQGTGKSSIMNSVSEFMINNKDAIIIFCDNYRTFGGGIALASKIREIQPNPIIFIADEFDNYVYDYESELKNLLDGKNSIPNSLFLAATNYIDKIPNTLKDRPSRFKVVVELKGIENKTTMYNILKGISDKLSPPLFTNDELIESFSKVDSITIDEIKQLALDKLTSTVLPILKTSKIGFKTNSNKGNNNDDDFEKTMIRHDPFQLNIEAEKIEFDGSTFKKKK